MLPTLSTYGVFLKETFTLPAKGEVTFSSETHNYGWNAERQREYLEGKGRNQIQQEYLEFYQRYYPGTIVKKLIEYKDDSRDNVLVTIERYGINNFWKDIPDKERYEVDFYASAIAPSLDIPDELYRTHPLHLPHPVHLEQILALNFEEDSWYFDDEKFIEDNEFFRFSFDIKFDKSKRQLSLAYTYQSKTDYVPPESYTNYLAALKKVDNHQSYGIYKAYPPEFASAGALSWYSSYVNPTSVLIVYGSLYFLVFLLWRIDRRRNPDEADSIFFPVSIPKLLAMWILTSGIYGGYWFYKNFHYIKKQKNNTSMPMARGIFYSLWYYPLWHSLKEDCDKRFGTSHLPSKVLAIPMALVFLILMGTSSNIWLLPSLLFGALLVLPLANYILLANDSGSVALKQSSAWSFRHYLLVLLSIPWCAFSIGSEVGLMPNEAVIKGNRILEYNITLMQRRGTINPGDEIDYFYSDAFLLISDDGNGFTQRHVFSYWKDGRGSLEQEQATYSEVKDIKVDWKTGSEEKTIVTIVREDDSEFLLLVSNIDHKDKIFVNALKERWQRQR